jgi:hypothetical protein
LKALHFLGSQLARTLFDGDDVDGAIHDWLLMVVQCNILIATVIATSINDNPSTRNNIHEFSSIIIEWIVPPK